MKDWRESKVSKRIHKPLTTFQGRNSPVLSKKDSSTIDRDSQSSSDRMSSSEGLREITNEISSLLSEGAITIIPQHQQNGRISPSHSNNVPTLTYPSLSTPKTTPSLVHPNLDTSKTSTIVNVHPGSKSHRPVPVSGVQLSGMPQRSGSESKLGYSVPRLTNPKGSWTNIDSPVPHLVNPVITNGNKERLECENPRPVHPAVTGTNLTSPVESTLPSYPLKTSMFHAPVNHNGPVSMTTDSNHTPLIQTDSFSRPHSSGSTPRIDTGASGYRTGTVFSEHGQDVHTSISRPIFGISGSGGVSSNVSSQSHSAVSSFSNLQQFGGDSGMEYGNETEMVTQHRGLFVPGSAHGRERDELERQVKAHAQTIDILVNEKTVLQSELSTLKTQLSNKTKEGTDVESQLKVLRLKIEEIQRERSTLSDELARSSKALAQSRSSYRKTCDNVDRLRGLLEDQQQENTELISKITSQSAEVARLQSSNTELQSKLNMAELLTQQLSGGAVTEATPPQTDPALAVRLKEVESEATRLRSNIRQLSLERDQAYSDLTALRESLVQQQEDNAQNMSDIQSKLADNEVMVASLGADLDSLRRENENLKQQVSTEHAQKEHTSQTAMETLHNEKEVLQSQLQSHIQDNAQLTRLNSEQERRIYELELEMSRLKEQSVDQKSLLTTITQDKEAVSRAMSQNKELKANITELQDAFVRLSQQNMELASDLETERLRVAQLKSHSPVVSEGCDKTTPTLSGTFDVSGDGVMMTVSEERSEVNVGGVGHDEALAERHKQEMETLLSDKANLQDQFVQLQSNYSTLSEQHQTVLQRLETVQESQLQESELHEEEKEETDFPMVSLPEVDVHNMSVDELTMLQTNFNALQQKFVNLMKEKVELLDKLQENDHLIVQLSYETETIGDYVTLYQAQRDALKSKFKEKDKFIEQLMQEKTFMQGKLRELQSLTRQVLTDRSTNPPTNIIPPTDSRPHPPHALYTSSPSLSPVPADLPFHLRPQYNVLGGAPHNQHPESKNVPVEMLNFDLENKSQTEVQVLENRHVTFDHSDVDRDDSHMTLDDSHVNKDVSYMTFGESQVTIEGDSLVSTATTEQILHLLDELETDVLNNSSIQVPCRLCVGPVVSI